MNSCPKYIHSLLKLGVSQSTREICALLRNSRHGWRIPYQNSCGIHTTSTINGIHKLPRGQHTIPDSQNQVEISREEWPFVERLLPVKTIPKPQAKPGEVMPSGWVAPSTKPGDYPYHVLRNANHMLPVYVKHTAILCRLITVVRYIEGDIYALGEELREYLAEFSPRKQVSLQIHEPHQMILIRGQRVNEIKDFLLRKGF